MESLLNRLISLSFARQIHEHFFPGSATDALSRQVTELGSAVRADSVESLRRTLDFVSTEAFADAERVRRFAVQEALELGKKDLAWRSQTERLWRHFTARGTLLMARRGVLAPERARAGWQVASGS